MSVLWSEIEDFFKIIKALFAKYVKYCMLNIPGNDFIAGIFVSVFQVISAEHVQKITFTTLSIYPMRLILSAAIIWLLCSFSENSSSNLVLLIKVLLVCI